jgi:hypothetical protein
VKYNEKNFVTFEVKEKASLFLLTNGIEAVDL